MRSKINLIIMIALLLFACKKKKTQTNDVNGFKNGILVLNEGLFQQNNASMSWIDLSNNQVTNDIFTTKNGRQLGDVGNDMKKYGGKIYVVVTNSNTIEIMDANSGQAIKQVSMTVGSAQKQPRSISFSGSKAYITCYDGYVDVMDTISLQILTRIKVGDNPEQSEIVGNKLYVTNSGGLNSPVMDSTVSVIDLQTYTEIKKIVVGKNPGGIKKDENGDVYVISRGNYGSIPSRMHRINTNTDLLEESFLFDASSIVKFTENKFLINYFNYNNNQFTIKLFDTQTEQIIADPYFVPTEVELLYGIVYSESKNKLYCLDALNYTNTGYVRQYSITGTYETSYHVGLLPSKILIYE